MSRSSSASFLIAAVAALAAFLLVPRLGTERGSQGELAAAPAAAPAPSEAAPKQAILVARPTGVPARAEPPFPADPAADAPRSAPASTRPATVAAARPEPPSESFADASAELQRKATDLQAPLDERVRALRTLRLREAAEGTPLRSDEVIESSLWLIENAPDLDDRSDAVTSLQGIRQPWAIERLGGLLLGDPHPEVRRKIARLLSETPSVSAARYLERALESEPDEATRALLAELVGGTGPTGR